MEKNGVATSMISISAPGVYFGDEGFARDLARSCNEILARLGKTAEGLKNYGGFGEEELLAVERNNALTPQTSYRAQRNPRV